MVDLSTSLDSIFDEAKLRLYVQQACRFYFPDVSVPELEISEILSADEGPALYKKESARILLHPTVLPFPKLCGILILHELIHHKLWTSNEPNDDHGERFKDEIKRLWKAEAFDGLL